VLGISGARGAWLDRDVMALLPSGSPEYEQSAVGADVEYSRNYWLVRGEFVWSRWRMPFAALASATDLDARAWWIEGRYRFSPRIFAAARFDRLVFSEIPTDEGGRLSWDAPVWRIEGNMGYYLRRNLVARLAVQHNDRDGGRVHRRTYVSGQLAYWF
jgi:predicted porin